jgi:hypothetical protein
VSAHALFQILDDLVSVAGLFPEQAEDYELDLSGLEHGSSPVAPSAGAGAPLKTESARPESGEQVA